MSSNPRSEQKEIKAPTMRFLSRAEVLEYGQIFQKHKQQKAQQLRK